MVELMDEFDLDDPMLTMEEYANEAMNYAIYPDALDLPHAGVAGRGGRTQRQAETLLPGKRVRREHGRLHGRNVRRTAFRHGTGVRRCVVVSHSHRQ